MEETPTYIQIIRLARDAGIDTRKVDIRAFTDQLIQKGLLTPRGTLIRQTAAGRAPVLKVTSVQKKIVPKPGDLVHPGYSYSDTYEYSSKIPISELTEYGRKIRILGAGGFGEVSLYQKVLPTGQMQQFAIKIPLMVKNAIPLIDMIIEVAMLIRLRHPNIIPIYDLAIDRLSLATNKPIIGLVMPVATTDMSKIDFATQSIMTRKKYAYSILAGLSYMHARNIVHRDLKFENILIFGPDDIRISDFGTAKPFACSPNTLFNFGGFTLYYRSPEALLTSGVHVDTSSDIWSIGLMLWTLFNKSPRRTMWPVPPGRLSSQQELKDYLVGISKILGSIHIEWTEIIGISTLYNDWASFPVFNPNKQLISNEVLTQVAPNISPVIIQSLSYNPKNRPTAYQILSLSFFNDVRPVTQQVDRPMTCIKGHKLRDRNPNIVPANLQSRSLVINGIAFLTKLNERSIKTYQVAISIFDLVYKYTTPKSDDDLYILLVACFSLAEEMSELISVNWQQYIKTIDNNAIKNLSILDMSIIRIKVLTAASYDLIFTVPYDYYVKTLGTPENIWKLTISFMVIAPVSELWFKLLPEQIFDVCYSAAEIFSGVNPRFAVSPSLIKTLLGADISQYDWIKELFKERNRQKYTYDVVRNNIMAKIG